MCKKPKKNKKTHTKQKHKNCEYERKMKMIP